MLRNAPSNNREASATPTRQNSSRHQRDNNLINNVLNVRTSPWIGLAAMETSPGLSPPIIERVSPYEDRRSATVTMQAAGIPSTSREDTASASSRSLGHRSPTEPLLIPARSIFVPIGKTSATTPPPEVWTNSPILIDVPQNDPAASSITVPLYIPVG